MISRIILLQNFLQAPNKRIVIIVNNTQGGAQNFLKGASLALNFFPPIKEDKLRVLFLFKIREAMPTNRLYLSFMNNLMLNINIMKLKDVSNARIYPRKQTSNHDTYKLNFRR